MTPDRIREHATAYIRDAASASWSPIRSYVADVLNLGVGPESRDVTSDLEHLIRTATITVTWPDAQPATPSLPAWLIEATDQLVDDLGHPAPGSLTALVASAYRAGQMAAQSHGAKLTPALRGDGPCQDCGTPDSICGHRDRAEAWPDGFRPDVYLNGDSGYLWLTCNRCDDPLAEAQAGDNLADLNAKASAHRTTCAGHPTARTMTIDLADVLRLTDATSTQPAQEAQQ